MSFDRAVEILGSAERESVAGLCVAHRLAPDQLAELLILLRDRREAVLSLLDLVDVVGQGIASDYPQTAERLRAAAEQVRQTL